MKMYKVNIKRNNEGVVRSVYFKTRKGAIEYRNYFNDAFGANYKATLQSKYVTLAYHHNALEKGYFRKGDGRDDYYNGKFGIGIKRHLPNCEADCANMYHVIEYYIEKE